jgi:uncharacterized caspase-like protein
MKAAVNRFVRDIQDADVALFYFSGVMRLRLGGELSDFAGRLHCLGS